MKVKDLILHLSKLASPEDEVYITDSVGNHRMRFNPDITLTPLDPTEEDESGGFIDIDGEPIKGKPWHLW